MGELPKVLYKYRDWSNIYHQSAIRKGEFYLAQPKTFEDEFDCNIPLDFESITDEQLYDRFLSISKEENENYTRQMYRNFTRGWVKKSPIKNTEWRKKVVKDYFEIFNKETGVLFLTANPESIDMWNKYSDKFNGFCIGFNSQIIQNDLNVFGSCGPVMYVDELPKISPLMSNYSEGDWIKQTYTKLNKWGFKRSFGYLK